LNLDWGCGWVVLKLLFFCFITTYRIKSLILSLFIHYSLIPSNINHFKNSSFLLLLYEMRNVSISVWHGYLTKKKYFDQLKNYGQGKNLKGIHFKVIVLNGLCLDEVIYIFWKTVHCSGPIPFILSFYINYSRFPNIIFVIVHIFSLWYMNNFKSFFGQTQWIC